MKMRNTLVIIIGLFVTFTGTSVFASGAEISATNEDGKAVVIALDSNNTPREDGDSRTYPTIKDFRDDYTYSDYCYSGSLKDTKALLKELVNAANGDGDSWAELDSISSNSKKVITVVAIIIDESGENEESYTFSPCK